jgi:hypothetical protein
MFGESPEAMIDWPPFLPIAFRCDVYALTITYVVADIFYCLGGYRIVVEDQTIGVSLGAIVFFVPWFNGIVAAFMAAILWRTLLQTNDVRETVMTLVIGYAWGTVVAWILQIPLFVPIYNITNPSIYYAGPLGMIVAAILRRRKRLASAKASSQMDSST